MRPRAASYQSWLPIITKYDRYTALLAVLEKDMIFFGSPKRAPRAIFGGLADQFLPAGRR